MKSVTIENEILICPECGQSLLHQQSVVTEFREREDGVATRVSTSDGHESAVVRVEKKVKDVAGRRDNIYITFVCEVCYSQAYDDYVNGKTNVQGGKFCLHIQQHKGSTYFRWI